MSYEEPGGFSLEPCRMTIPDISEEEELGGRGIEEINFCLKRRHNSVEIIITRQFMNDYRLTETKEQKR